MSRLRPLFFAPLVLGSALAAPVVVGGSVGVPRAGVVPATLTLSTPLVQSPQAELWARGDVTFGLGTRLFPAFGLGLVATSGGGQPPLHPSLGLGATTISSASGMTVRPYALLGLDTSWGKLGARLDTVVVFTDAGPRPSAALGLTYRFDVGSQP